MPIKDRPGGFLLLETLLAVFIISAASGSALYLAKTSAALHRKVLLLARARILAGSALESVSAAGFEAARDFDSGQDPGAPWSRLISCLPGGQGKVAVTEMDQGLKKVAVTVGFRDSGHLENTTLETMLVK
jgi:hypothetical protein